MSFLLIPNEVKSVEALVWIGISNENINVNTLSLRCNGVDLPLLQNWQTYVTESGKNSLIYQYLRIQDLQPHAKYFLELYSGNRTLTTARVRTLPNELPALNETPFTVLLASCFASARSESVSLGSTYLNLQRQQKTDIKILCGDQVYLDDPTFHYTVHTHSKSELEDKLLSNYLKTWSQNGMLAGYQQFLQNGANFFSTDDHEFWNNAPSWASLIRDTWSQKGRDNWFKIAASLLRIFQSNSSVTRFEIGNLSFFIADTRVNRDGNQQNFMSNADLNDLDNWVTTLPGVGVLAIGQPLFSEKAGFWGKFVDRNLSDYKQYEDLVRILSKTEHSILLLTGDVHYGRISRCQLKSGIFLYEIISSPTSLVDKKVGGKWDPAPTVFPAFSIPGVAQKPIETDFNYQFTDNHFLTLSFYRDGTKTRVIIKNVPVLGGGQSMISKPIADLILS